MKDLWREVYDNPVSKDPFAYGTPIAPLYLDIEPTNNCNFNCKFCVGKQQATRPKGFMDIELFKSICIQAKEMGTHGVRFLRWGEPMLHPEIINFIRIAKKQGLLTHITTNGSLVDAYNAVKLIDSGLDSIIISLQGLTAEESKELRSEEYEKVVGHVLDFITIRNKSKARNPFVQVSTSVTDESDVEQQRFRDYWLQKVDGVTIGSTWFKRLKDKEPVKDFLPRAKKLRTKFKCIEVMTKLSIDWDGAVSPCCLDYDQELTIGNANTQSLKEIWHSMDARAIRKLLANEHQEMFVLCSTCELNYDFRGQ